MESHRCAVPGTELPTSSLSLSVGLWGTSARRGRPGPTALYVPCASAQSQLPLGNHARERSSTVATIATVLGLSHQTGVTLAEVGFLSLLFAGVWLVAAQIPAFKMPTARTIVAGIALALAGVLLIIATHWGHFG